MIKLWKTCVLSNIYIYIFINHMCKNSKSICGVHLDPPLGISLAMLQALSKAALEHARRTRDYVRLKAVGSWGSLSNFSSESEEEGVTS